MVFTFVMFIADVGSIDKTTVDGFDNCEVDEPVVVDIFTVVVSAVSLLPHTTIKFSFGPPVKRGNTILKIPLSKELSLFVVMQNHQVNLNSHQPCV